MGSGLQGHPVTGDEGTSRATPTVNLSFAHDWQAEILAARPLILPQKNFVYPAQADEVERGALEVLVRASKDGDAFLATCALGFRDAAVPTGIWSCPKASELCAVSGGYAYVIDTVQPGRFTMIAYRPVLEVHSVTAHGLLIFVGHHSLLAWGVDGLFWESEKLSDEGVTITGIDDELHGLGWNMMSDREYEFTLDLRSGRRV
jgi:hypothetical protein